LGFRVLREWATEVHPKQSEFQNEFNNRIAMYLDDPSVKESLLRMTGSITPNFAFRQDLLQEAWVHLWLTETRRPGQTKSWYLQSAKFHVLHYLTSGRSVDSRKRWRGYSRLDPDCEQPEEFPELVDPGDSVLSQVSARDIISLLSPHLSPCENAVLEGLADGLGVREIGRRLKISHTMVVRHRSKIASLLLKLEGPSFLREQFRGASAVEDSKQANGVRPRDRAKSANGAKWSSGLKQRSHTNGATQPCLMPAEVIPLWKRNGFLKPSENLNQTAQSNQAVA